ncbi:MAG: hypothetical protein NC924_00705, partial [Candidatus Omnitrophica bacterium]|nr:hypothetical protein [Candidatus Omnitrophota bacterium]
SAALVEKREAAAAALRADAAALAAEQAALSGAAARRMYAWLISVQQPRTGLVLSYQDEEQLPDVGYTYDQALSAFAFIHFRDTARAERIFEFYRGRADRIDGGFAAAYDVRSGRIAEYTASSGPPIYLALAMLAYEKQTGRTTNRRTVEEIAGWLLRQQQAHPSGAIPGGAALQWVSCEQNIAGAVLFTRLADITAEPRYVAAAEKIAAWVRREGYNQRLQRFNRGQDDRMIASDVAALGILAFGGERLAEWGIGVEDIVRSVEDNCRAQVRLRTAGGQTLCVQGFDFCAPSSIGRAGTIAVEWTAQMILAFHELAEFYQIRRDTRARHYRQKALFYQKELDKLMRFPAEGAAISERYAALPYAADSYVDTGHGWQTPRNTALSVAGTVFAIFAREKYNIFRQ